MAGNAKDAGRTVVSRLAGIISAFTEGDDYSLTELAYLARLPISTAHRLVAELTAVGLLERTQARRYTVSAALRTIGVQPDVSPTLAERAPCILEDLVAATGTRARLGVLRVPAVAYIEKEPGFSPVTGFHPAAMLPAHATAVGRVLLAFSPPAVVDVSTAAGLRCYTPHTLTCPDRLRRALAVTRLAGVGVTRFEFESGVCGVAVPVVDVRGQVVAGIELAVHDLGAAMRAVLPALHVAGRSLARELGGSPRSAVALPWCREEAAANHARTVATTAAS